MKVPFIDGLRTAAAVAALLSAFAREAAAEASEPDKAMCVETYRSAQVQRRNGALKRARESLLVCVSDRCPSLMQPDCTRWLTEVEAALPSISFAAKGVDGKDLTSVRVTMDGQILADSLDGKSVSVDPGPHVVRFEHGGQAPIEQTIVVREGEKARVVDVSWARPESAGDGASARDRTRPPATAWILGGIGVAGLATFGVLAIHGMQRRSELERACFGSCRQDQVDSIKTELVVADIALGAGIAALTVSTILFVSSGSSRRSDEKGQATRAIASSSRPVFLAVAPRPNGAAVGLGGRF